MNDSKKKVTIIRLSNKHEYQTGGFIFRITSADGNELLKEFYTPLEKDGVLFCRNWLKTKYNVPINYSIYEKKEENAKPE